jgi:hypothetical protein
LKIKGGFGNQLFQYASAFSLAKRLNKKLYVESSFFEEKRFESAWKLPFLDLDILAVDSEVVSELRSHPTNGVLWKRLLRRMPFPNPYNKRSYFLDEMNFKVDSGFYNLQSPVLLEGWFLKPDYFIGSRSELLKLFRPRFELSPSCNQYVQRVSSVNSVSIHVRRTDYVNNPLFVNLDEDFYVAAIDVIKDLVKDPVYFVFSDDVDWCKNFFKKMQIACEFVQCDGDQADLEDFEVMKNCRHQIIANSSFSWWAAFLNEYDRKVVITSKVWYKDLRIQKYLDEGDGFLLDWICIDHRE